MHTVIHSFGFACFNILFKVPRYNMIGRMPGNRDSAWLICVFILTGAAFGCYEVLPVRFDSVNDIADFQTTSPRYM